MGFLVIFGYQTNEDINYIRKKTIHLFMHGQKHFIFLPVYLTGGSSIEMTSFYKITFYLIILIF